MAKRELSNEEIEKVSGGVKPSEFFGKVKNIFKKKKDEAFDASEEQQRLQKQKEEEKRRNMGGPKGIDKDKYEI